MVAKTTIWQIGNARLSTLQDVFHSVHFSNTPRREATSAE